MEDFCEQIVGEIYVLEAGIYIEVTVTKGVVRVAAGKLGKDPEFGDVLRCYNGVADHITVDSDTARFIKD